MRETNLPSNQHAESIRDQGSCVHPASKTWTQAVTVGARELKSRFNADGMVIIRGLLEPSAVRAVLVELERRLADADQWSNVRVIGTRNPLLPSYDLEDNSIEGKRPIRKITGLRALSPVFARNLVENETLLSVLHTLLGPRVELYRDAFMLKSARIGQEKPWHQDAVYWPWRPMALVSAMIALDEATTGNGCLQVIRGSHREVAEHYKQNWELQTDIGGRLDDAEYVPLAPGDCLVFHSLLLHASERNRSDAQRRASIVSYSPGGLESLGEAAPPVVLSERPTGWAR